VLAETIVVPATPYEARKVLGPADTLASLAGQIIDPSDATKLIRVADVPGLVNVPPILRGGDAGGDTLLVADYHHGRCGRAIEVRATCNAAGDIELKMGATGQVPDCERGTDFLGSPVAVTLHAGVPVAPRWDNPPTDFAPLPIHWMFDGARVIFLPPMSDSFNPFGNRSIFTEYLFHPPQGFYLKDNFPNGGPVPFYYVAGYACPAGQLPGAALPKADYRTTIEGTLDPAQCYRARSDPPLVHDPNIVRVCTLGDSRTTTTCSFYEASGQFATLGLTQD
jgi:hypothetical protein